MARDFGGAASDAGYFYDGSTIEISHTAGHSVSYWMNYEDNDDPGEERSWGAGYYAGQTEIWQVLQWHSKNAYAYSRDQCYSIFRDGGGRTNRRERAALATLRDGNWKTCGFTKPPSSPSYYLNGADDTSNWTQLASATDSASYTFIASAGIGCQYQPHLTLGSQASAGAVGDMAEWAFWNTQLTAQDHASLTKVIPLMVHPESIIWYMPMLGDSINEVFREHTEMDEEASPVTPKSQHPAVNRFEDAYIFTPEGDGGGGDPPVGGGERRAKLLRDITAGLTRNLSRNLHNYVPAPLPVG